MAWAGLRGGKALRVTKPVFPPRAPPFRARRCSALWYATMCWKMPVCCCIGHVQLCRWVYTVRKAVCIADLFLAIVILLVLICSCLLLYFWCSPASACWRIAGAYLLLPVGVLLMLTCFCLLAYHWHRSASANNREQARCAGRFPVRRNKKIGSA